MLRLVRFDLFKSIRSISTWVIVACIMMFTIASVLVSYISINNISESDVPAVIGEMAEEVELTNVEDVNLYEWCCDAISGDFLLLFIIVFAVVLVGMDYSSGFIKNIYRDITNKGMYIISKSIVVASFIILSIIVSFLTTYFCNIVLLHASELGDIRDFLICTIVRTVLCIAFGTMVVCVTVLVRKSLVALIVSVGYAIMLANPLYLGVNQFIDRVLKYKDFQIEDYTIIGNILTVNMDITNGQIKNAIVVSVVVIVLSIVIATVAFKQRDAI